MLPSNSLHFSRFCAEINPSQRRVMRLFLARTCGKSILARSMAQPTSSVQTITRVLYFALPSIPPRTPGQPSPAHAVVLSLGSTASVEPQPSTWGRRARRPSHPRAHIPATAPLLASYLDMTATFSAEADPGSNSYASHSRTNFAASSGPITRAPSVRI